MPNIEIDNDVWAYLQSKAIPFQDVAPNDVLRREFGLNERDMNPAEFTQTLATAVTTPGLTVDTALTVPPGTKRIPVVHSHFESLRPDRDYTYHPVRGYKLEGDHVAARSFKDVLISMMNRLRGIHGQEFDRIASTLRGRKRVYFSRDERELKYPYPLAGNGFFMETNLNANLIVGICRSRKSSVMTPVLFRSNKK